MNGSTPVVFSSEAQLDFVIDMLAGRQQVFLDGVLVASESEAFTSSTFPATSSAFVYVGRDESLSSNQVVDGTIDEVRVRRSVPTAAETLVDALSRASALVTVSPPED